MNSFLTLTPNPALDIATNTEQVLPTHKLRCGAVLLRQVVDSWALVACRRKSGAAQIVARQGLSNDGWGGYEGYF